MTARELANIPIRIYGVLWMVNGFFGLGGLLLPGVEGGVRLYGVVNSFAVFAIGVGMFLLSETIALRLFPGDSTLSISATADQLLAAAFGVMAVWLVAHALVSVAQGVYMVSRPGSFGDTVMDRLRDPFVQNLVSAGAQIVIGIGIFAGRDSLAALWRRMRPMATTNSASQDEPTE